MLSVANKAFMLRMLSVVMLNVIMLTVSLLNVIQLNVLAPPIHSIAVYIIRANKIDANKRYLETKVGQSASSFLTNDIKSIIFSCPNSLF
jgi:hypothetical protein